MATEAENRTLSNEAASVLLQSIKHAGENEFSASTLKDLAEAYATVNNAMRKPPTSGSRGFVGG